MNCESIEQLLSAYHDQMLGSNLQGEVEAHLRTCEHCSAILADYEAYDALLAVEPPIEPAPELRDRIFSAPEYLALLRELGREGGRGEEFDDAPETARAPHRGLSVWRRVLLPVAAALALVSTAGFAAHGLVSSGAGDGKPPMVAVGNPGSSGIPLAAGNRVVYEHGGQLWSAAENDNHSAQALTPEGTHVAAWAVAPQDTTTPGSGAAPSTIYGTTPIAYIDTSGKVHMVRADGQTDMVVGNVGAAVTTTRNFWATAVGSAVQQSLRWSPGGYSLAYVSVNPDGSTSLAIYDTGAQGGAPNTSFVAVVNKGAFPGDITWSAGGQALGYSVSSGDGTSVWFYDNNYGPSIEVATHADLSTSGAQVGQLVAVSADAQHTGVTWTSVSQGVVTGIYSWMYDAQAPTVRFTPTSGGAVAAFGSNQWLVSDGVRLSTVALSGRVTPVGNLSEPVTSIAWNAQGDVAAIVSGSRLTLWTSDAPVTSLSIDAHVMPVWSADGQHLAYATSNGVVLEAIMHLPGMLSETAHPASVAGAQALQWAQDGKSVAVSTPRGVILLTASGTTRTVDGTPADGGAMTWSVAG